MKSNGQLLNVKEKEQGSGQWWSNPPGFPLAACFGSVHGLELKVGSSLPLKIKFSATLGTSDLTVGCCPACSNITLVLSLAESKLLHKRT